LTSTGFLFIRYSRIAKGEWAMILKPQDVLVLLKLVSIYPHEWAYNTLAVDLGMSPSEVHAAVKRSVKAGLANQGEPKSNPTSAGLKNFLFMAFSTYSFRTEVS
jgi:predicted transcriptional regulator